MRPRRNEGTCLGLGQQVVDDEEPTRTPDFLTAFHVYWGETQIKTCSDPEMTVLDMYITMGVQLPAALGGRRDMGTVKVLAKKR